MDLESSEVNNEIKWKVLENPLKVHAKFCYHEPMSL